MLLFLKNKKDGNDSVYDSLYVRKIKPNVILPRLLDEYFSAQGISYLQALVTQIIAL